MARAWRSFRAPASSVVPTLLLIAIPALCQLPDLSGWLSADPIYPYSGLSPGGWRNDGVLPGQPWIDGNAGGTVQALGGLAATQWLSGAVPWWNHYSGVGMPLAAEMQPAAFFLPFVLLLRAPHGLVLLKIAMMIIAGLATYALLRRLALGTAAALLGALLFQLNGTFAWFADAPSLPVAFLPLLLLGIERARDEAGPAWRHWALVAIAVAWSLFAGFPETAYLNGLLAVVWSLVRLAGGPNRRRLLARLAIGVAAGMGLAAPLLLAFGQLMRVAYVGIHAASVTRALHAENWAMLLFPHLFGAPLHSLGAADPGNSYWWFAGGYVSPLTLLLAVVGALSPGRERTLRRALALFLVLVIARAGRAAVIQPAVDLIPLVRLTEFSRYAIPSAEMSCCVLAAFALDRWRLAGLAGRVVAASAGLSAIAAALALWAAWPEIASLAGARHSYIAYPLLSVGWGVFAGAAGAWMLTRRPTPWLAILVAIDAIGLFIVPTLAGARHRRLESGLVDYLRDHLGLQRAYTMGPISPNYGAWFGVPTIDDLYLPAPLSWTDFVARTLDPLADKISFNGISPPPASGQETRAAALRARRDAFAATGVALVAVPAGADPFRDTLSTVPPPGRALAARISSAEAFSGVAPADLPRVGSINRFGILAATYAGQADGTAHLRLCAGARCVDSAMSLTAARDNAMLEFPLDPPLALTAGETLAFTLTQAGGAHPFAVWLQGGRPALALTYVPARAPPPRVYSDANAEVFALSNASPYFETSPSCDITPVDWTRVRLRCPAAATLSRQELAYPGWRATLDGADAPVRATRTIFQAIDVPAGEHVAIFRYAPPHVAWAWLLAAVSAMCLAASLVPRRPDNRVIDGPTRGV